MSHGSITLSYIAVSRELAEPLQPASRLPLDVPVVGRISVLLQSFVVEEDLATPDFHSQLCGIRKIQRDQQRTQLFLNWLQVAAFLEAVSKNHGCTPSQVSGADLPLLSQLGRKQS